MERTGPRNVIANTQPLDYDDTAIAALKACRLGGPTLVRKLIVRRATTITAERPYDGSRRM